MAARRARFGKRSRATIGYAAAIFVAVQFVAGYLLDNVFPLVRFPLGRMTIEQAVNEPVKPNVVFLGSSRTGAAVEVPEANRILDAAKSDLHVVEAPVAAGDSLASESIFKELLARGIHPKWIVVEVSPETLNTTLPFMRENAARMLKWKDVPEHLPAIIKSRAGWIFLEARLLPLSTHRRELVRLTKKSLGYNTLPSSGGPPSVTEPGSTVPGRPGPATAPAVGPAAPAQPAATLDEAERLKASRDGATTEVRRWLRNYRLGGIAPAALERLLARARDENVGVILLAIPACTAHRQEFTPAIDAEYHAYLNRLVQDYGCRFVDASDWVPDALFEDALHVAAGDGANFFTRRFTREVLLKLPAE